MESLTFFGVSVEYFSVFERFFGTLCSFHFGDTMEFSVIMNSTVTPEKVRNGSDYDVPVRLDNHPRLEIHQSD